MPAPDRGRRLSLLSRILLGALAVVVASRPCAAHSHNRASLPLANSPVCVPNARDEQLPAAFQRQAVFYRTNEPPGTIIVDTVYRYLYLVQENSQGDPLRHRRRPRRLRVAGPASRHPQGGMAGLVAVAGRAQAATAAAAIHEGRSRESVGCTRAVSWPDYRIHGTNQPQTIGNAVFAGCYRLTNADVIDLYARVPVGGKVVVRQRPSL